jgi:hypothetical protein
MHGNPHQPHDYPPPYPQTVIVQKKGGGCRDSVFSGGVTVSLAR